MKNGFTIIELIIVLAIISISASAGYVSYTRTFQSSTLKKDAQDFGNLLSIAKDRTIRRDMTPNTLCTEFGGYEVQFINTTSYQLRFICRPGGVNTYVSISPVYSLATNMVFVLPPANAPFFEPYGCIDPTYPDSNCANTLPPNGIKTIKIQNQNLTNTCITVTVNNLGVITVGDPGVCS